MRAPVPLFAAILAAAPVSAPASAQPRRTVDPARWVARAERLEADTAALRRDWDGTVLAMRRHALALDPAVADHCGFTPDGSDPVMPYSGFTSVVRLGPAERLVLVSCTTGAILGNTIVVPYLVRLEGADPRGAVRRLAVPGFAQGRPSDHGPTADDTTFNGLVTADARRRRIEVVNRCCAGTEGTTSVYALTPGGDLSLVRATEWRLDRRDREHVVHRYVAPPDGGVRGPAVGRAP